MRPLRPEIARSVRDFPYVAAICLAYFLSIRWGHAFVIRPELVAAFWPPAGVLTAVLLLTDSRSWPLILVGALLTNLVASLGIQHPLLANVEHAVFDCAQCLGVAYISRRFLDPPILFDSFRQFAGFAVISVICSGLGTGLGAALLQGHPGAGSFREIWRICWVSHTFGLLLLAPAILSWYDALRADTDFPLRERVAEGVLYLGAVLGVTLYSFTGTPEAFPLLRLRSYIVFPLLIWGAVRFGIRGAAGGALVAVSIAVYRTSVGLGPFAFPRHTISEELLALQFFMGAAILTSLLLAALNREQLKSRKEVEERNRELTLIQRISEIASDSHAKENVIDRIAETIGSLTGFRHVAIELFDASRERLLLEGARGFPLPERGEDGQVVLENPLSMEVARSGKAVVESRSADRAAHRSETLIGWGSRRCFAFPWLPGGKSRVR